MNIKEIKDFAHSKNLRIIDEPLVKDNILTLILDDNNQYVEPRVIESLFSTNDFREWRVVSVMKGISSPDVSQKFPPNIFQIKFIKK